MATNRALVDDVVQASVHDSSAVGRRGIWQGLKLRRFIAKLLSSVGAIGLDFVALLIFFARPKAVGAAQAM